MCSSLLRWYVSSLTLEGVAPPLLPGTLAEASGKRARCCQLRQIFLLSRKGHMFQRANSQGSLKRVMQTCLALEFMLGKLWTRPSRTFSSQAQFEAIYHQEYLNPFSAFFDQQIRKFFFKTMYNWWVLTNQGQLYYNLFHLQSRFPITAFERKRSSGTIPAFDKRSDKLCRFWLKCFQ